MTISLEISLILFKHLTEKFLFWFKNLASLSINDPNSRVNFCFWLSRFIIRLPTLNPLASLSVALAKAKGLNQATSKGKEVYVLRPKDYQGKPRIFKSDISSPSGYLVAGEFNLQAEDIVFVGTAGITSWSRFINQVLPFTNFINSAEDTDLIKN